MKKETIGIMLMLVLAMGGVFGYYAGESFSITLPQDYEYYSIVGNSTPINLTLIQEGLNLTITFDKYQKSDTFEMIFFDNKEIEIEKIVYRGGGGGTIYKDKNITVIQPLFLDRNNTIEVEINNCTNETIEIPQEDIEPKRNFIIRFFKWIWGIFT